MLNTIKIEDNDLNKFIKRKEENNKKQNVKQYYKNNLTIQSYKDEIINFFDEIKPKIFISISFNNTNLNNDLIKARIKKIFIEYYKFKHGKNWPQKLDDIELKYFLIIEHGKSKGHNHCHILLNSNHLNGKYFARELKLALNQFKRTQVYNVVFKDIDEENKVSGFDTILVNDIYNNHNLYNYLLKEIACMNNQTDFSNIIPWNELITLPDS